MQKAITTSNNTNQGIERYQAFQNEISKCPELKELFPPVPTVAASTQQNYTSSEEVYAELPMTNDADQQENEENEENEESATQSEMQDDLQDTTENTQVAQSNGWVSRLTSVPSKIASSFNPLNWFLNKNTSSLEQPKNIIIEQQDLLEGEPSATLSEVEKSLHPTQKFPSTLDPLTPADSEFTDADSHLTGNDSNLLDN